MDWAVDIRHMYVTGMSNSLFDLRTDMSITVRFIGGAVEIAQATHTRDQSLYVAVWVLLCVGTISILAALTDPVVIL